MPCSNMPCSNMPFSNSTEDAATYHAAGLSYRSFNGVVLYEPWDAQPDATDDVGSCRAV